MAANNQQFWSIQQALGCILRAGACRSLVAERMTVRDAGAIAKLMSIAGAAAVAAGEAEWVLVNRPSVEAMARSVDILLLMEVAVLPVLRDRIDHDALLDLLDALLDLLELCGQELHLEAAMAGGSFSAHAATFCAQVTKVVDDFRALPPHAESRDAIDALTTKLKDLLGRTCTMSQAEEVEVA